MPPIPSTPPILSNTSDKARPVVVLTGASRGIGHATVSRFLAEGWEIISCSREPLPPECRAPSTIHHFPTDLAKPNDIDKLLSQILECLAGRPVNALVNNAALSPKQANRERLGCLNGSLDGWRSVFELNFFAPLALSRGLASSLAKGRGAIVNITSIAGLRVHPFAGSAYSTSKAALSALTREMAVEFAEIGVRVNAVCPGEIATAMIGPEYEPLTTRIPLQRLGTTAEVAAVIYQLCQQDFSYVTGSEIFLTGGQHLW